MTIRTAHLRVTPRQLVASGGTGWAPVPAGQAGGPPWPPERHAQLLDSLEAGWPVGQLLAWSPAGTGHRAALLDGHRRLNALMSLLPGAHTPLVRDCASTQPRYLPAGHATGRSCLPVDAMLSTVRFLAAAQPLPAACTRTAETAASRIIHARLPLVMLTGGTDDQLAKLCHRLIPGRVD